MFYTLHSVKVVCSGQKMHSRLSCHPSIMPVLREKQMKAARSIERALATLCAIRGYFTKKDCARTYVVFWALFSKSYLSNRKKKKNGINDILR